MYDETINQKNTQKIQKKTPHLCFVLKLICLYLQLSMIHQIKLCLWPPIMIEMRLFYEINSAKRAWNEESTQCFAEKNEGCVLLPMSLEVVVGDSLWIPSGTQLKADQRGLVASCGNSFGSAESL
jgi:hypothetical protein